MIISRIVSLVLRVLILASSAIVAGIVGNYLKGMGDINAKPGVRFIYTEVVAGISLLASIILLIPTTWALTVVPFDIIVFILWIVSFGLLAGYIAPLKCSNHLVWVTGWGPSTYNNLQDQCNIWKTALSFILIAAILWLLAGLLGMWVIHRNKRSADRALRHRRWYRSNV